MKFMLIVILALSGQPAHAWDQALPYAVEQCQPQAPYGFPQSVRKGTAICRSAYVTLNDTSAKLPIWVSYSLTPENALGCIPRSNGFTPDKSLAKGSRAELADYAKTGYDIGHVAPNADMSWNKQAELESFLLTNMVPQLPGLNRSTWKLLETSVRGWVTQRGHQFVVYAGPLYGPGDTTIGDTKVVIPHAFFKIVIDTVSNESAGFLFPHQAGLGTDLTKVRAPISQIEQLSGISFAYPTNVIELNLTNKWSVDFGVLTKAKQAKCKK